MAEWIAERKLRESNSDGLVAASAGNRDDRLAAGTGVVLELRRSFSRRNLASKGFH
jgi:hypothetical protein